MKYITYFYTILYLLLVVETACSGWSQLQWLGRPSLYAASAGIYQNKAKQILIHKYNNIRIYSNSTNVKKAIYVKQDSKDLQEYHYCES